jgi:hypothetical protein
MSIPRIYCSAAARAIRELDKCAFGAPDTGQDELDWKEARRLLYRILDRNGYELSAKGSGRLKKRAVGPP